jgi:hypothetical protein
MLEETLSYPRYAGVRTMQSPADPNKVLVEIKTDGKPLRFSILAGDTYHVAELLLMAAMKPGPFEKLAWANPENGGGH